jgi:hypothetical protein
MADAPLFERKPRGSIEGVTLRGSVTVSNGARTEEQALPIEFDSEVASDMVVMLTPTQDVGARRYFVSSIAGDSFTVELDDVAGSDLTFMWLLYLPPVDPDPFTPPG